jgi:hypothetical protein
MSTALRFAVGLGRFVYGFVVGDDLAVALVMLLALLVTAVAVARGVNAWWLVPPLAALMTGVSLWRKGARAG